MNPDLLGKITPETISEYEEGLKRLDLSPATIRRRLSTLRKFSNWAKKEGYLKENPFEKTAQAMTPPRWVWRKASPLEGVRKGWGKIGQLGKFGKLGVGVAIALLLTFFLSRHLFPLIRPLLEGEITTQVVATYSPWIVDFRGKLTTPAGEPITKEAQVVFRIYDQPENGFPLWESKAWQLTPNPEGEFQAPLGDTTRGDYELPSRLFFQNERLYLGISVNHYSEVSPRLPLSTASHVTDSYQLDEFPPSQAPAGNMVPVLTPEGYLILAADSPKIKSTSGTFALEGQAVSIVTPTGSDGDISLAPDGAGGLNLIFSGQEGDFVKATNANLTSGSLYYGEVASDATGYNLIELASGSTPTTKFSVDAQGNVLLQGLGNSLTGPISFSDQETISLPGAATSLLQALNINYQAATGQEGGVLTDGGTYLYPTNKESIRIYDSIGTKYIDISHSGAEAILSTNLQGILIQTDSLNVAKDMNVGGTFAASRIGKELLPLLDDLFDLGSSALRWRKLWAEDADFSDDVDIAGSLTVQGTTLATSGDIETTGDLRVDGSSILGDASDDTVTFNARISSHLIPSQNITYDLGSSALRWRKLWAEDADFSDEVNIGGSLTVEGTTLATTGDITTTGDLTVEGNTTLGNEATDTTNIQGITSIGDGGTINYAQFNATGDLIFVGSGDTISGLNRLTFRNAEYISNETDDLLIFAGASGSDNTDLYLDLDGTYPVFYSQTDAQLGIDDRVVVTGVPSGGGEANIAGSALYVNPASSTGDGNLIGASVNDAFKFRVDAEGDIFGNSLTLAGAEVVVSLDTTLSNLTVEGDTQLGDAVDDILTVYAGTSTYNSIQTSGVSTGVIDIKPLETDLTAAWEWDNSDTDYDDNTTEAGTSGGTPFELLGQTSDYFYFGYAEKFDGLSFDLETLGSYGTLTWEYWDGSWTSFTPTTTYSFTTDGYIIWNTLSGWTAKAFSAGDPHSATPPDTTARYWIRISPASVTTAATVNQITLTMMGNALAVYPSSLDTATFVVKPDGQVGIGTSAPDAYLDILKTVSVSSGTTKGLALNLTDDTSGTAGYSGFYLNLDPSTGSGSGNKYLTQFQRDIGGTDYNVYTQDQYGSTTITQRTPDGIGTGADGAITVSTTKTIDSDVIASGRSYADAVNFNISTSLSSGATTIDLGATPNGLAVGDEILIINLRGTSGDYANVGQYETKYITAINGNILTLNSALSNSYDGTTQKIMVQRIPQYTNVTVQSGGTLTVSAYNNTNGEGGVLFFRAAGEVIIDYGGSITAAAKGYSGGNGGATGNEGGYGGMTYNGTAGDGGADGYDGQSGQGGGGGMGENGSSGGTGTLGGGGGGGGSGLLITTYAGGGGGGGYGTVGSGGDNGGSNGSGTIGGDGGDVAKSGGGGGGTYGSTNLSSLYLGSGGGGAGGYFSGGYPGGDGGNGGGILFIGAPTITVSGTISADGDNGADGSASHSSGGGGGTGGSLYLKAKTLTLGSSLVTADGGSGGLKTGDGRDGGPGGDGRTRLDYTTLSGTTSPAAGSSSNFSTPSLLVNRSSVGDIFGLQYDGVDKLLVDESGNITIVDDAWIGLGSSAARIEFDDQSTDEVNILSANVGIGTSEPGQLLELGKSSGDPAMVFDIGGTDKFVMGVDDSVSDNFTIETGGTLGASTTPPFVIDSSGNVGIGTTGPMTLFDVSSSFHVTSEGNVGIGTSAPSEKLHLTEGNFLQTPSSSPTLVGQASLSKVVNSVFVSGRYAYVGYANYPGNDFNIYDVSNPASPSLVSGTDVSGSSVKDVFVSGRYAYLVHDNVSGNDFRIYDVSNPASPSLVGGADLGNTGTKVYVSGRYAYIANYSVSGNEFRIFDVSDPSSPSLVGGAELGAHGTGVYVSGRYAYTTNANSAGNEFHIYDVSDPSSPSEEGGDDFGIGANDVYVSGQYAYITHSNTAGNDFRIYDVSDPSSPSLEGGADLGTQGNAVFVAGRYAYVVNNSISGNEFQIYDVSDPASPSLVGGADLGADGNDVFVAGRYAYVAHDTDLNIYDISGLEATSAMIHSLEAGNLQIRNDALINNQLYVAGGIGVGIGGIQSQGPLSISSGSSGSSLSALDIRNSSNDNLFYVRDDGNIGIGTSVPSALVHLSSTAAQDLFRIDDSGAGDTTPFVIDQSGNVGIGNSVPGTKLSVLGLSGTSSYNLVRMDTNTGDFYYDSSSLRYKDDIQPLEDDFGKILELDSKTFTDKASGLQEIGLIAEEVDALGLKNLVIYDKEGQPDALKYDKLPLYLLEVIKEQKTRLDEMASRFSELIGGETSLISPLPEQDLVVDLGNEKNSTPSASFGKLIVKGVDDQVVASIDASGNATFSAKLTAPKSEFGQLLAKEATIAGTLYADKIVAKEIVGLQGKFGDLLTATFSAQKIQGLEERLAQLEKENESLSNDTSASEQMTATESGDSMADLELEPEIEALVNEILGTSLEATSPAELAGNITIEQSNNLTINENLTVLGTTSLADTSIAGTLNVDGTLTLADSSINSLSGTLYLQNLGLGGIDILAGKIMINEQGNMTIEGDVTVKGSLFANLIKPLPEQDLVIDLEQEAENTSEVSSGFGKLIVKGINEEVVASIDASGKAQFAQVETQKVVIASDEQSTINNQQSTTIETNATVGQTILLAGESEVTIKSPFVTENTMVYVTPISDPHNKVLYVKAKRAHSQEETGWFKVGVDTPIEAEIKFNWWVIN